MNIEEIEKVVDGDYRHSKLLRVNKELAVSLLMDYYDFLNFKIDFLRVCNKQKRQYLEGYNERFVYNLGWTIKQLNNSNESYKINDIKDFKLLIKKEFHQVSLVHEKMEDLFISYHKGIYKHEIVENDGLVNLHFTYIDTTFANLEAINQAIIEENNTNIQNKLLQFEKYLIEIGFAENKSTFLKLKAQFIVNVNFSLPDTYMIMDFSIIEIKRIWSNIVLEALITMEKNKTKYFKKDLSTCTVHNNYYDTAFQTQINYKGPIIKDYMNSSYKKSFIIDTEKFTVPGVDDSKVKRFFEYHSFNTGQSHNLPFLLKPFYKNEDGKVISSTRLILNNKLERNTISLFNRMFKEKANNDSHNKEAIVIEKLKKSLSTYCNLTVFPSKKINDTDIDIIIYDTNSKALLLMESKWFIEPVYPIEILSKNEEIIKGLTEQLPKYKKFINNNPNDFCELLLGDTLEIDSVHYFVFTQNSIGSFSKQVVTDYKVINFRMLMKALEDTKGNLKEASYNLQKEQYYPRYNYDIRTEKPIEIENIRITNEVRTLLDIPNYQYTLSCKSNTILHFFDLEIDTSISSPNMFSELNQLVNKYFE